MWFGAFVADEIIGCCRLCTRLDEKFEVEHYLKQRPLPDEIRNEQNAYEANRFATRKKFKKDIGVFALITGFIVEYSLYANSHIFSTTGYNNIDWHTEVGYEQCDFPAFSYDEKLPPSVHLVYTTTNQEKKQIIVDRCKKIFATCQQKAPQGFYDSL
jgi:hypothetical protein